MSDVKQSTVDVVDKADGGKKKMFPGLRRRLGLFLRKYEVSLQVALFSLLSYYILEFFITIPFATPPAMQVLNWFLYAMIGVVLFCVTRRLKAAMILETALCMVVGLVDGYVYMFRSSTITPFDLLSIGTAVSVMDKFDFTPDFQMFLSFMYGICCILLEARCCKAVLGRGRWKTRLAAGGTAFALLAGILGCLATPGFPEAHGFDTVPWTCEMNLMDGTLPAFFIQLGWVSPAEPEGYDAGVAAGMLGEDPVFTGDASELPDVIVVMNEAFSDLEYLADTGADADTLPFLHAVMGGGPSDDPVVSDVVKNGVVGWLSVPVLGGNTANTEFEFLTGCSMRFLPLSAVPYQQYVRESCPSVVKYMKSAGYECVAMHPYLSTGWKRDIAYPFLGFDEFLDYTRYDYENEDALCRGLIADEEDYRVLLEELDDYDGSPRFLFNVTIQNHGGYNDEGFVPDIVAEGDGELSQYLAVVRKSDEALHDLVGKLMERDRKTVLVFFGDHQPALSVSDGIIKSQIPAREFYTVPYLIWTNFGADVSGAPERTSPNFLAIDMLRAAGLELPAWQGFLEGVRDEYTAVSAHDVIDAAGRHYDEMSGDEQAQVDVDLLGYARLQYWLLIDRE